MLITCIVAENIFKLLLTWAWRQSGTFVQNCSSNFHNFVLGHRKYSAPNLPHRRKAPGVSGNPKQLIVTQQKL